MWTLWRSPGSFLIASICLTGSAARSATLVVPYPALMTTEYELPSQRRRRQRLAEREREHGIRWSEEIAIDAGRRIQAAFMAALPGHWPRLNEVIAEDVQRFLQRSAHDWETPFEVAKIQGLLRWGEDRSDAAADLLQGLVVGLHGARNWLDFEPVWNGSSEVAGGDVLIEQYLREANAIFEAERIAWAYVGERVVEREQLPLHAEIIAPLDELLTEDARFERVARGYQHAIRQLAAGELQVAVTAMTSALEDALAVIGAEGQTLGAKTSNARQRRLIPGHEGKLFGALSDWATGARSATGMAHGDSDASEGDARFAMHLAGAAILRLADLIR